MKGSYAELERACGQCHARAPSRFQRRPGRLLAALYGGTAGCVDGRCAIVLPTIVEGAWQKLADWRKRYPDSVTAKGRAGELPHPVRVVRAGERTSSAVSAEGGALFSERLRQSP